MLHTRLDTLETVDISSPEISPRILYGTAYPADIVRTAVLYPKPSTIEGYRSLSRDIPYLRLTPSSKWAVRLIPVNNDDLSTRAAQLAYLARRDGWNCFYCDRTLDATSATIEHIICTAHGGPTHADNLCLSCGPCNAAMGSLPGVQKMRLAIGARVGMVLVKTLTAPKEEIVSVSTNSSRAFERRNKKRGTK